VEIAFMILLALNLGPPQDPTGAPRTGKDRVLDESISRRFSHYRGDRLLLVSGFNRGARRNQRHWRALFP
jgi:hypothetical protein